MTHSTPSLTRRQLLGRSGATVAAALGAGTLANLTLGTGAAHAADYKALVSIFLYGGNDGTNTIVPMDVTRYGQYSGVRGKLALDKSSLVALSGADYGLHPSLSALLPHWRRGALAPVFNVGPLGKPTTRAEFLAAPDGSPFRPDALFSHSDQQTLWETAGISIQERTGWGGRGCAVLGTANPVISVSDATRFGAEAGRSPLVLPLAGRGFGLDNMRPAELVWEGAQRRKAALDALYAQSQTLGLRTAYVAHYNDAMATSTRLDPLVSSRPGDAQSNKVVDAAFAPFISGNSVNGILSAQLYQIARLIANNAQVQGNRQMYFASQGGYDTHGQQLGAHADLLRELGDALNCFHTAMQNLGLDGVVTSFTQSDFGRTLAPNGSDGTDHAWGNHHLVLGGSVKGGKTYGTYPTLQLGGPDDAGDLGAHQGRWIPTSAVDQYAATLLGWFGVSDSQLATALPNIGAFKQPKLGFL
ncbi:MAG: DUF1501 domain-containing protein [Proteobacteria bacterium]|nr:DUF1501 domain-containing protein [Pseudomonadota bacterium]